MQKNKFKHIIILVLGWFFLVIGVAGLVLPFLQGILFIVIGLFLLSRESGYIKEKLHIINVKVQNRFPEIHAEFHKVRTKAEEFVNKILGNK
ncbi:MAG: PGPGW domain-containing protein [Elusimicrobiota bacterium]